jgi:hypothetical protein
MARTDAERSAARERASRLRAAIRVHASAKQSKCQVGTSNAPKSERAVTTFGPTVPFSRTPTEILRRSFSEQSVIAMAGGWATGDPSSIVIGKHLSSQNPTHTIHLGDIRYAGSKSDGCDTLVAEWPQGTVATFTVNSNHEGNSGGSGCLDAAATPTPRTQHQSGLFALTNDHFTVLGLDTAYGAEKQDGRVPGYQMEWVEDLKQRGLLEKKVILLTHHEGIELSGKRTRLWQDVVKSLGRAPDYWYWGRVHGVAVFKPFEDRGVTVRARLVGHGGIPYVGGPASNVVEWVESERFGATQRYLNGFVVLRFDGPTLKEEFWDEKGRLRHQMT